MSNSFTLTNISQLVTNNAALGEGQLGVINDAAITVTDGIVSWVGQSSQADSSVPKTDVGGRSLIPGFVDSHSHIMFAGDRSEEFAARMAGVPYSAGGIKVTTEATRKASDAELRTVAQSLISEMQESGTTTVEIKSGYGLDVATEERSLRIAAELTDEVTYLGAHVVAPEFVGNPDEYVDLVIGEMLQACAPHSKWIDVFCDRGAFTTEQSRRILEAGINKGLQPRIHLNQLEQGDGVAMAIELDCASADHLTYLTDEDISALAASSTVAGLVPGADFSTRAPHYPRGRDLIDAGAAVALSPDCNPGSSPCTSLLLMLNMACTLFRMTPQEALAGVTVNAAKALGLRNRGQLATGQRADFCVWDLEHPNELAYWFGHNPCRRVVVGGLERKP